MVSPDSLRELLSSSPGSPPAPRHAGGPIYTQEENRQHLLEVLDAALEIAHSISIESLGVLEEQRTSNKRRSQQGPNRDHSARQ